MIGEPTQKRYFTRNVTAQELITKESDEPESESNRVDKPEKIREKAEKILEIKTQNENKRKVLKPKDPAQFTGNSGPDQI